MKKLILFGTILCVFSSNMPNDKLEHYYSFIIKAEENISKEKYSTASECYLKAFSHKSSPFVKDICNAINCYLINRDTLHPMVLTYLAKIQTIENKPIDSILLDNYFLSKIEYFEDWQTKKKQITPVKKVADTLKNEIRRIINSDQFVRKEAFNKYGANFYKSAMREQIKQVDSLNRIKLLKLYQKNVLNESTIGSTQMDNICTIALHNMYWGNFELLIILKQEVFKGNLNAFAYADLSDRQEEIKIENNKEYYGTLEGSIMGSYYFITLKDSIDSAIDYNRNEILLSDTYVSALKRSALVFQKKLDNYFYLGHVRNIEGGNDMLARRVIDNCKSKNINLIYFKKE